MIDEQALARQREKAEATINLSVFDQVLAFQVVDEQTCEQAVAMGRELVAQIKALESERDEVALPLYRAWKRVRKWWQAPIDPRVQAKEHLRSEVGAYRDRKRAEVKGALEHATTHEELTEATAAVVTKPDNLVERTDWYAEAADGQPLPKTLAEAIARKLPIPADYYVLDESRLHAEAKQHKQALNVPGVRAVSRKSSVFRT